METWRREEGGMVGKLRWERGQDGKAAGEVDSHPSVACRHLQCHHWQSVQMVKGAAVMERRWYELSCSIQRIAAARGNFPANLRVLYVSSTPPAQ